MAWNDFILLHYILCGTKRSVKRWWWAVCSVSKRCACFLQNLLLLRNKEDVQLHQVLRLRVNTGQGQARESSYDRTRELVRKMLQDREGTGSVLCRFVWRKCILFLEKIGRNRTVEIWLLQWIDEIIISHGINDRIATQIYLSPLSTRVIWMKWRRLVAGVLESGDDGTAVHRLNGRGLIAYMLRYDVLQFCSFY